MPIVKTKTNNKVKAKQSGWKRRFDLTNRKVQFFAFIAIVAVLGGGYFTIRSFAAVRSWVYNVPSNNLKIAADAISAPNACTTTVVNDPQKNNQSVINLFCKPGPNGIAAAETTGMFLQGSNTNVYRLCMNVRGQGTLVSLFIKHGSGITARDNWQRVAPQITQTFNTNGYQQICTEPFMVRTTGPLAARVSLRSSTTGTGGGWFNLSHITLEQVR